MKLADLVDRRAKQLVKAELPKKPQTAVRTAAKRLSDQVTDRPVDPEAADAIAVRNRAERHLRALLD